MAELPLDQAIPRFKTNEDRVDRFTNGNETATWSTNTGQEVPSLRKFLKDKDDEINTAAGGILSQSQAARDVAVTAKNDAVTAKDAAQTASSTSQNWAESASAPGAPGTKSAKTWAGEAAASAATLTRADDADMSGIPNPATEKWVKPAQVRVAFEQMQFKPGDMANPRTLKDIMAFTGLTPFSVGAEATDSDHAPKLNTLYDRIITGGGGIAWLPPMPGDYKAGSSMPLHKTGVTGSYLSVRGTGDKARIKWLPSTGDAFVIGNGSNPVYYVSIENIYLYAAVARTSGIDFKLRKANIINLKNIVTDGSYAGFHGEDLNSVYGTLLHFNMPNQTTGAGVTVYSNPAGSGRTDIVKFDEVTVQAYNAGSYGLVVDGRVAGVHTDGFYALGVNRGLQIVSAGSGLANIPNFCDFRKFEVDRATNIAVVIEKGYRTEFSRCDISNTSGAMDVPYPQGSNDDCAMFLGPGALDTKVIGGRIGNCRTQALNLQGKNSKFIGTTFNDMSKIGVNQAAAVFISATANGFNFRDCTIEGHSRASWAYQIDAAAKNGKIRDTLYKDVVSGYSTGTSASIENTGQILCDYTY